jgi:sigma-B regulation protein RsbU (phosphoserine phosphatase)
LLTEQEPAPEGYELHARVEPCEQVGGDFYDVQPMPDGTVWLLLGDVSGKGVGAAILMSLCLSSARVLYDDCGEPGALASRLNTLLARWTGSENFVTAFIGKLMPDTGTLRYVNAGHVAPLILGGRKTRWLESTGLVLGCMADFRYRQSETDLVPGSMLALYSDGVVEARRGENDLFGGRRVERALKAAALFPTLDEAGRFVVHEVDAFRACPARDDDIALLLLRRAGAPDRRKP